MAGSEVLKLITKAAKTLKQKPKGIDESALSVDEFNKLGQQVVEPTALAAHTARGKNNFSSEAGTFMTMSEDQFVKATTVLDEYKRTLTMDTKGLDPNVFPNLDNALTPEAKAIRIEEHLADGIGRGKIKSYLKNSEVKLEKPLYVMRNDGVFSGVKITDTEDPKSIFSFKAVDPSKPQTLEGYGTEDKGEHPLVFKLPAGTKVLHPAGRADPNEVIVAKGEFEKSVDVATRKNYLAAIAKGAPLFGAAGVAATVGSENANASTGGSPVNTNQDNSELSGKIQGLLDKGTKGGLIYQSLAESGKYDPAQVSSIMLKALQPKIAKLRDQGISNQDIMASFEAAGIKLAQPEQAVTPQQPEQAVTPQQPEQAVTPQQPEQTSLTGTAASFVAQSPLALVAGSLSLAADAMKEGLTPPAVAEHSHAIATIKNLDMEYSKLFTSVKGMTGLDPAAAAAAKTNKQELDSFLVTQLNKQGIKAEGVNSAGEVLIRDPNTGELVAQDETLIDSLLAAANETGGAIMGAQAGFAAAPPLPPYAKPAGAVVGGLIGAMVGRGTDVVSHAMELNYKISVNDVLTKMNDAGVADVTLGALGLTVGKVGSYTSRQLGRGLSKSWDLFVAGNKEGAMKTLKEVYNLNDAKTIDLVTKWETLTGQKVLSSEARATGTLTAKDSDGVLSAVTEMTPGAESVIARAADEANSGGVKLAERIDARAKAITAEANKLTNDNIDVVLQDSLGKYTVDTKDFFEQTKTLGVDLMQNSSYTFNFSDTALVPAMREAAKGIHNSALRKDFYHYMERIGELGSTPAVTTKTMHPEAKQAADATKRADSLKASQAKRADLAKAVKVRDNAVTKAKALKTEKGRKAALLRAKTNFLNAKVALEDKHLAKTEDIRAKASSVETSTITTTPAVESNLRGFNNLLELRKTVNELRGDARFSSFSNSQQMKLALSAVDKEIATAATTHMPEGKLWLKQWQSANTEYSKMKTLEHNVLFKALSNTRVTADKAVKAIADSMTYTDPSTFMQVMGKLPTKTRRSVEGAVLKQLTAQHTIGDDAGKQAVSFHRLAADLNKVAFTQPEAQAVKRTVNTFAEVFKNDGHLLAAVGNVPLPKFQAYLTADPIMRAKYEFASTMFNAVKSRLPYSANAGRAALVKNLGNLLDNPLDAKSVSSVLKGLPNDPELKTALHKLAVTFVEQGKPEAYGKVPIYRVYKPGEFNKPNNTKLGKGMLYYTDKQVATDIAKATGTKVKEVMQAHKRIATPNEVAKLLGKEPTKDDLSDPIVLQKLQNQDWAGLAVDDKVLLFKQ